jgi:eukaryotic-like serine/threonine-protein kinase
VSEVLGDRYELGALLGAGGMARVVLAHDRLLDREVAVKLLRSTPDPVARERFVREARTAARLRHPDAVLVYDAGEHEGQPYIVMELVEGETLGDLLDREERLDVEVAVAITLGVLDVLAAAHDQGLIHRDVKPGNVLLPAEGGIKLADFGIAKAMDEATAGLTATGAVMGTATYLAPELVEGAASSPASDVYSVGCLLYAMLTGQPPFTGDNAVAIAYAQRHTPVTPIEAHRPEVPEDLRSVLRRALEKDPSRRYVDAAAMKAALVDGETAGPATVPLAAASAPPRDEPTRELGTEAPVVSGGGRRRRLTNALAGVLAVVLVVGLLGWWLAGQLGADDDVVADAPPGEAADGQPDEADDEAAPPDQPDETSTDEDADADEPPVDEAPAEPTTVAELISTLSSAPTGTYGEKHDDLLADLVDLTREEDPEKRAEEAEAVRIDLVDWVEDGEFDAELGRVALAILEREAADAEGPGRSKGKGP